MKFTQTTLKRTSDHFRKALRSRNITIGWEASFNLWAQIVAGKNYSAASSQAKAAGHLLAAPTSIDRIQLAFAQRSRKLDDKTVLGIFEDAIRSDLGEISPAMHKLWQFAARRPGSCFWVGDNVIGFFQQDKPGCLSLDMLPLLNGHVDDLAWMRTSPNFVADLLNRLAGISPDDESRIVSGSIREGLKQNEEVFVRYFRPRSEELSTSMSNRILAKWPNTATWERLDYDELSYIVEEVLEEFCAAGAVETNGWLQAYCDIGDALRDHVTARAREAIRVYAEVPDEASDSLAGTIEFAINKILN
jgi:hypothetical protein